MKVQWFSAFENRL